jgi:hypothetical protein
MDLKNFDSINFELLKKYDPKLVWNVKSLINDNRIHECFYIEYPVRIYLILSFGKGEHIRIHHIDKETGNVDNIGFIGETWGCSKRNDENSQR